MMRFVETADGLMFEYTAWGSAVPLSLAVLMFVVGALWKNRRRWVALAMGIMAAYFGIEILLFRATFDADSSRVYHFLRHNESIRWTDAISFGVQIRPQIQAGHFYDLHVFRRGGGVYVVPFQGLDENERKRVIAYVRARIAPRTGGKEPPPLSKYR